MLSRSLSCGTTTWRQNFPTVARTAPPGACAAVASIASHRADHLSPPPARARRGAARGAGAAREGLRHLADAQLERPRRRSSGRWPAASPKPACKRGEHLVVIGENRPRLYAAMLAAQALGAIPVPLYQDAAATEFVFPIGNADVAFAIVEDQEQVDKMIEVRASVPAARAHLVRRPAGAAPLRASPAWRRSMRSSQPAAPATPQHPGFFDAEVDEGAGLATSRRCSSPRARPAIPRAWCTPTHTLIDRAAAGAALRQAHRRGRGARLPAAGLGRPEHLLLRAVAGLRLRRQLPGVGEHGDDRPEARSARPTTSRRRACSRACSPAS